MNFRIKRKLSHSIFLTLFPISFRFEIKLIVSWYNSFGSSYNFSVKLTEVPELIRFLFYVPFHFIFMFEQKTAKSFVNDIEGHYKTLQTQKNFDGKTMIMIGCTYSVTGVVKRLMDKTSPKKSQIQMSFIHFTSNKS